MIMAIIQGELEGFRDGGVGTNKIGEFEGRSPSSKDLPLSCGTPCQERGTQGMR
jgi:hypothetical protein